MMERRVAPPENPFAADRIVGLADFGVHGHTRRFEVHVVVFLGKINGGLNVDAVSMPMCTITIRTFGKSSAS